MTGNDTNTNHWAHVVENFITVSGFVSGGGGAQSIGVDCQTYACSSPTIADTDDCWLHTDRDFNLDITPADLRTGQVDVGVNPSHRSPLADANLWKQNYASCLPKMTVEIEYMFFFPHQEPVYNAGTAGQITAYPSVAFGGFLANPSKVFSAYTGPGTTTFPPPGNGGVPMPGDPITVRGMHVWDCGHESIEDDIAYQVVHGYETEIHPPVAMVWLHDNMNGTATVFLKAVSKAPDPSASNLPFDGIHAELVIPGYQGGPVLLGPSVVDYNAFVTTVDVENTCQNSVDHPWAGMWSANYQEDFKSHWQLSYSSSGDLNVVTIDLNRNSAFNAAASARLMMGAHFTVAYGPAAAAVLFPIFDLLLTP